MNAPAKKPSRNHTKLLKAARALFVSRGYAETGTEEIVARAGVTRGALYHQFSDKKDLFRALFLDMLNDVAMELFEKTMDEIAHDREDLVVGTRILLDLYSRKDIKQVILLDGPAVLGWEEWRELQEPLNKALVTHSLEHLVDEGILPKQPLEPLADLIGGSLMQAGLAIANAKDPDAARKIYAKSLEALLAPIATPK
ncbi:MAG: TetR/AcrR family transcriptional regulator [Parvibaculaceae bacterium]|nr:TetR/AcrR family transcriptional regulator [Parvibaculaceae bacterium]HBM88616.1 TetR/AcrR family transcriptional regulator [Rhodobiaceae bacterium]|tara:strand:- start:237 stop:830 length:594 start_codon:yes stop_codon:yes gene_type:complete